MSIAFIAGFLIQGVAADGGDDFSNNLFSDLAPLLALFGERFTMQFMSQSMGWADNIVLAMAPLGIITVVVVAIRVGGPSWLKAIVGRARENLAVAEAELMSSTSKEVCELWNGQQVVRVMGTAPVREFIILTPERRENGLGDLEVEVNKMDEVKDRYFEEESDIGYSPEPRADSAAEKGLASEDGYDPKIIVMRNKKTDAPNITLNVHDRVERTELRVVAVIGLLLQAGGFLSTLDALHITRR
ncbi:hypothetical protein AJ79_02668 [Helicocarpus griseus UAMH5409]|uniref:ABC transmembrane type-1 domain-containing protein n=1 Tax=Helicocarpus griseus UAMH5409 TaxID=1447875 RepID=A0A2B7Y2F2_9EURO|nr:hypothetical protein AJ79_02668 [Helicocarpus griseus UAMH5409]